MSSTVRRRRHTSNYVQNVLWTMSLARWITVKGHDGDRLMTQKIDKTRSTDRFFQWQENLFFSFRTRSKRAIPLDDAWLSPTNSITSKSDVSLSLSSVINIGLSISCESSCTTDKRLDKRGGLAGSFWSILETLESKMNYLFNGELKSWANTSEERIDKKAPNNALNTHSWCSTRTRSSTREENVS